MNVSPWICAAVFAGYLIVDWLAARYTLAITERQPARAATTGAVMYLFMAGGVIAYTTKPLYVLPAAAGSWLGTYLAIRPRRLALPTSRDPQSCCAGCDPTTTTTAGKRGEDHDA